MSNLLETVTFWKNGAVKQLETADILFKNRRHDACLFFCHLALEKILKGLIVGKIKQAAPYMHDLVELADKAGVTLSTQQKNELSEISTFNIASRYDSMKLEFYKLCTREYTSKYLSTTKKLFLWLEKKYPRK